MKLKEITATISHQLPLRLAHKEQRRKSGEPYIVHPVAVAELLAQLKVQVDVIISGLQHGSKTNVLKHVEAC